MIAIITQDVNKEESSLIFKKDFTGNLSITDYEDKTNRIEVNLSVFYKALDYAYYNKNITLTFANEDGELISVSSDSTFGHTEICFNAIYHTLSVEDVLGLFDYFAE